MDKKELFNVMNNIDENIVDEAAETYRVARKRNVWIKAGYGVAAAAAVALVSFTAYRLVGSNNYHLQSSSKSHIGFYKEYDATNDYAKVYKSLKKHQTYDSVDGVIFGKDDMVIEEEMSPITDVQNNANGTSTPNSKDFSETNVMTEGVDESDIVKTDGKYIYMVDGREVLISDISKGEPVNKYKLKPDYESPSDEILEMYVNNGRLVLIASHIVSSSTENENFSYNFDVEEETVCYSYDVSDPLNPKLIGKMKQDGGYTTSRKIGDIVYLFSSESMEKPDLSLKEAIKDENLNQWIPQVNNESVKSDCIYLSEYGQRGTLISSFRAGNPEKILDSKYVMNGYAETYVSKDAIYFYARTSANNREVTTISKMNFEDGKMFPGASESVSGVIMDNFAISQQGEYLVVLTTSYNGENENNILYILDSKLKETGSIDGIARGERVYAARFIGKMVYFITYKQVDPLFVADISDPYNPKLLGELEVDGFSEYLHIWDENHVLGIGYMTEDAVRTGIRLTMFDVADPTNPVEENSMVIDGAGYSEALYGNYKAILADPEKNMIGFAAEYDVTGDDYYQIVSKYTLIDYNIENGFSMVEEADVEGETGAYRGLYSGNNFYVAGNGEIQHFVLDK